MKKIYGFAFASAIMMLASCSNENEPNPAPVPDGEVNGYVSFSIKTAEPTRAGNATGYDDGDKKERNAKSATFLFFDSQNGGIQTQAPQTIALSFKPNAASKDEKHGVSDISDPIVAISGRENKPDKAIVILNCPSTLNFNGKTLSDVLAMPIEEDVASLGEDGEGAFIMSNAAHYLSDGTEVIAVDLTDKVYDNRDEAAADGVSIYVERLAAKVQLKFTSKDEGATLTPDETEIDVNGPSTAGGGHLTILPKITGITLANQAETMNVVKQIGSWASLDINDSSNFRVNWATTPATTTLKNFSYDTLTSREVGTKWEADVVDPFYIRENTLAGVDQISNKTSVLITAQLQVKASDGTLTDLSGLVRWAGVYFTPDQFKVQACNFLADYFIKDETEKDATKQYKNFATPEMLKYLTAAERDAENAKEIADLKAYETVLHVVTDKLPATIYVKDSEAEDGYKALDTKDVENTLNATLEKKENQCWYWGGGKSYYFVEIASGNKEYTPTGETEPSSEFEYGVVRNNSYEITLKSLGGLGVPIYNPAIDIIPETPFEKLWYVGATVNILQWRTVSQDAEFKDKW